MSYNNYDNNLPGISYFNNNATSNLDLNYNGNSDIPQNNIDSLDSGNESYIPTNSNNNGVDSKQGKARKKVTQACENCRKKRRKCTGERPKCLTCQQYNYVCYYNPFPKKRGPQQKRKKRKYKKRDKGGKNDNDSDDMLEETNINENSNAYNYAVIEHIIKKRNPDNNNFDFKITPSIFNDFISYNECINFKDKLIINENPNIGSELINYVIINYYYKYFNTCFPVVSYNSFAIHAKNGTLSKYLLFAMYAMAYLFQPNPNIAKATEYIEKAKALILQNYGSINVQILQAIYLVMVFESGSDQSWIYSSLGIKMIINNSLYFMNAKKNKYILKEDIDDMRSISLIILSHDSWLALTYKDKVTNQQLISFLKERSNLLLSLTSKVLTINYEYYVLCVALFLLESSHIDYKIKNNDFTIEDIDCINTDILKAQHYFLKNINDVSLVRYNDISDDFSYYLEYLDTSNEKRKKKNSKHNASQQNDKGNFHIDPVMNDNNNLNKSEITNYPNPPSQYNINDNESSNNQSYNSNNSNQSTKKKEKENNDNGKKDSRVNYFKIVKDIAQDEKFFITNHHFLDNDKVEECSRSSYDILRVLLKISKDFSEQKRWVNFFLITIAARVYINRVFILHVLNDPEKMKKYPIAKSIAIASKSADDCSMCLKILLEVAEKKNYLPLRFSYVNAWAFYQCCVFYILRYLATQEMNYLKSINSKQSTKYSIISSFPLKTLAPCYFYLDLLKQMREYFVNVKDYIRGVKVLIYEAEKSIRNRTFEVHIEEIYI